MCRPSTRTLKLIVAVLCQAESPVEVFSIDKLDMAAEQGRDDDIMFLRARLENDTLRKLEKQEVSQFSPRLKKLLIWASNLCLANNLVVVACVDQEIVTYKVVIPLHLYEQVIRVTHETTLGHAGAFKTIQYIKSFAVVPGIDKIARQLINQCRKCVTQKAYTHSGRRPMSSVQVEAVGIKQSLDHVGPLRTCDGFSYILVICDNTSKFVQAYPQKEITAVETLSKLKSFYATFGYGQKASFR